MPRNALIIGYVWPEPGSSAAGRHMLEIIRVLQAAHWQLTFASAAAPSDKAIDLQGMGIAVAAIELNSDSFDAWLCSLNPQLVIFDRYFTEEQYGWRVSRNCPEAMRVLDTEDLHCLRESRRMMIGQAILSGDSLMTPDTSMDMVYREIASIYRSDLSLIISDFELDLLQEKFEIASERLHYFPFLNNLNETAFEPPFASRSGFVFVGTFRHAPNLDALRLLKKTLWPLIRQQLPEAVLSVAGSYMTQEVAQMHNPAEGFEILGHVDDLAGLYARHRVMLAPLQYGAGLKGKLIEAMEHGLPSVTTPIGAEGITRQADWPGFCVENVPDLAEAAASLHEQEAIWYQARQAGRDLLKSRFDEVHHMRALSLALDKLEKNLPEIRQRNFIGRLLQHHAHASTEYMSRWIACKNRRDKLV